MKRPVLLLLIFYLLGIVLHEKVIIDLYLIVIVLSISCAFFLRFGKVSFICLIFLIIGFVNCLVCLNSIRDIEKGKYIDVEATVVERKKADNKFKYTIRVNIEKACFKSIMISEKEFDISDKLKGKASFTEPVCYNNFNTFNYRKYLMSNKIFLSIEKESLKKTGQNSTFYSIRKAFKNFVHKNLSLSLSEDSYKFASSLVLGEKEIDKDYQEKYSELGVSHLLAISGLHISIIINFLDIIGYKLKFEKKKYSIFTSSLLIVYGFLIGFPISLIRALTMYIIRAIAIHTSNIQDDLNTISISLLITLIINPFYVYSAALWFSYSAVFSVMVLSKLLIENIRTNSILVDKFIPSLSIQLGMFPIQVFFYNQINLFSVFLNVLIIPLFPIPVLLSFINSTGLGRAFRPFAYVFDGAVSLFNNLIMLCSKVDFFLLSFNSFGIFGIGIYYFIIIFILILYKTKRKDRKKLYLSISFIILFSTIMDFVISRNILCRIDFIDVGQGDSILIQSNNTNVLVDTGGNIMNIEKSSKNLYDSLYKKGVSKLHAVFLSHEDFDHMGNMESLLKMMKVDKIYLGNKFDKKFKADIEYVDKKDKFDFGKVRLEVVYAKKDAASKNDSSVVLLLTAGKYKTLLMGDLEEGELQAAKCDIDILKVSHHGSKNATSDEFLKKIRPEIGVISVGAKNRYGHPTKEALNRLKRAKVRVYKTLEEGAVRVTILKDTYFVDYYYKKYSIIDLIKMIRYFRI